MSSPLGLSIQVGLWCVILGLPVALPLGWLLARVHFRGKSVVTTLVMAPVVLPPVVTGFLLLRFFGASGLDLPVPFTMAGAVIAAFVVGLPFYVMAARSAFEAVDPRLEEVSKSLGHPPLKTFARVTLPLAAPGIAAGAVLAFARGLGEFGATAVIAGNMEGETRTLALAIYTALESIDGEPQVRALVITSVLIAFATLAAFEGLTRWQRRRLD